MDDKVINAAVAVAVALVGLAAWSVLFSGQGQAAANVFGAAGKALSSNIAVAVSPVTGSSGMSGIGTNFGTGFGGGYGYGGGGGGY